MYSATGNPPQLEMVPITEYEKHILDLWYDAGTVAQGAHGIIPLSWSEIIAWANQFYSEEYIEWIPLSSEPKKPLPLSLYGRPQAKEQPIKAVPIKVRQCTLLDYELKLIRKLSQEYAAEYAQASDKARVCPKDIYIEDVSEEDARNNADAMEQALLDLFSEKDDKKIEVVPNK